MSYYHKVECQIDSHTDIDFSEIQPIVEQWITEQGYSKDLIDCVKDSFETSDFGFNKMHALEIIDLYQRISENFPDANFYVRGKGEELDDIWYRHFQHGNVVKAIGWLE